MPGAITHIIVAIISAYIVYAFHFKFEYAISTFIGNLIPDAIPIMISAIKHWTFSLTNIVNTSTFYPVYLVTSNFEHWLTLGFFVFGSCIFLYHYHFIKKKTMKEYAELYVFFLIGILIHLILDALISEKSLFL